MKTRLSFLTISILLIISVGTTAYIYVDSESNAMITPTEGNARIIAYQSILTSELDQEIVLKNPQPFQAGENAASSSTKTKDKHTDLQDSGDHNTEDYPQQNSGNNSAISSDVYLMQYMNNYFKGLSGRLIQSLIENMDEYMDDYIDKNLDEYLSSDTDASDNLSSDLSDPSDLSDLSDISSDPVSDITPPEPPIITDEFIVTEIKRLNQTYKINIMMDSLSAVQELTNSDIAKMLWVIENAICGLPKGLLSDFSVEKIILTTNKDLFFYQDSIYICHDDSTYTLTSQLHDLFENAIIYSDMSVNLWQFNPPDFGLTGPSYKYTFDIKNPSTSYFVTYEAQTSEPHDLSQIFFEIINGYNRFVRLTEDYPLYNKMKLACNELSKRYPSLNSTETVQAFS